MKLKFKITAIAFCLTIQLITLPQIAQSQQPQACRQELANQIAAKIEQPQYKRSRWGITIQNLTTQETIYDLDGDKFFIPASTVKLLTTAAALKQLGADFRVNTPIYATGELPNLDTVRIQGKGDPTITSEILQEIAQQLQVLGIKSIKKLIIDDSYFTPPLINPTWEWGDTYYYYATTINSLILNQNTASLSLIPQQIGEPVKLQWQDAIAARQWQVNNQSSTTLADSKYTIAIDGHLGKPVLNIRGNLPQNQLEDVWDLRILAPENYFLETFRSLLEKQGIIVNQGIVITESRDNPQEKIIAQISSPPLSKIITETNQESNNLYAEVLLKIIGKKLNLEDEILAFKTSLNQLDINPATYHLLDASGLSRHNLITPKTLNKILRVMAESKYQNTYQKSLAIAGSEGTLKNRLKNTPLQNNLWAKTGSLSGVITLSGYVKLLNNQTIIVTILVNNFDDKNKIVRQTIDEILLLLPQFQKCL